MVKVACRNVAVGRVVGAGPGHCCCRVKCQGSREEGRAAAPQPPALERVELGKKLSFTDQKGMGKGGQWQAAGQGVAEHLPYLALASQVC